MVIATTTTSYFMLLVLPFRFYFLKAKKALQVEKTLNGTRMPFVSSTNSASAFVDVWKKNTVFDKVLQCAHPVSSDDEQRTADDSSHGSVSEEFPVAENTLPDAGTDNVFLANGLETTGRKRSLDTIATVPPSKKKRPAPNPIDLSIEEKKLVCHTSLVYFFVGC